jgi:hypothetical protein
MRLALRVLVLLVVFLGVGLLTAHGVVHHASAATPVAEVRLSAAMAGLFAGGAAAVLVGIAMVWRR